MRDSKLGLETPHSLLGEVFLGLLIGVNRFCVIVELVRRSLARQIAALSEHQFMDVDKPSP
jgi:hypothetical protein